MKNLPCLDRGFSLLELLVVTIVLAVLSLLAMPTYQQTIRDSRRALAAAELMQLAARQDSYFLDHKRYAQTLADLGKPADPYAIDGEGQAVSSVHANRIYRLELQLEGSGFILTAHPERVQAADTACGVLSLTDYGLKGVSGPASLERCW